jgi:hypothetical protein
MLDLALDDRILLNSKFDCALQEIDMTLNTECTELLGDPYYGVSMDMFLWTLTPTTTELKKYIYDKLANETLFASQFNIDVNVQFIKGEIRSIYLVQITLSDTQGNSVTKKYQYQ